MKGHIIVFGLLLFCQGCYLVRTGVRNVVSETHGCVDTAMTKARNRLLADASWNAASKAGLFKDAGPDFSLGFKEGFMNYLEWGTDCPPPLPPRRYWRLSYQNAKGHQAIENWFSGFRQGAAQAQESGLRQWQTVSTSVPPGRLTANLPAEPPVLPAPRPAADRPAPASPAPEPKNEPSLPDSIPGDSLPEFPLTLTPPTTSGAAPKSPPAKKDQARHEASQVLVLPPGPPTLNDLGVELTISPTPNPAPMPARPVPGRAVLGAPKAFVPTPTR